MARHDVVIHAPWAASFYDRTRPPTSGGAERQTYLLALALARRGLRVAHVVFPVAEPAIDPAAPVTLIQRPRPDNLGSAAGLPARWREVWEALSAADAQVQVLRGANGMLGAAATWSRRHRRRLVFAAANNSDFTLETFGGRTDPRRLLYAAGLRFADDLVVQTDEQVRLARERFPRAPEPRQVNSFVEPAPETAAPGEAFLWVSRLVDYKRPLLYADLAAALPEARFWMIASRSSSPELAGARDELERRSRELPNLELLPQCPHEELQALIGRAVAMVNTSEFEGMPNTWLEGWARGVPALTLGFDPDERIATHGLGVAAGGSWDGFVAGARRLWEGRADRAGLGPAVRAYVADAHGERVAAAWAEIVS
jgi:glycosyltransferase involved in cell wall biosynthesis